MKIFPELYIAALLITGFAGCKKNDLHTTQLESTAGKGFLKVAYLSASANNQNVQVKINDQRVSGIIPYSFGLPGGGTNIGGANATDYFALEGGSNKISLSIPKSGTNTDSIAIFSTTINLPAETRNTLFITDTFPSVSSFIAVDTLSRPDSGSIKLRFVHVMPDVPSVDVYKNATLLFSNVPYKGSTGYITTSVGSDTLKIRAAGALPTATPIITRVFANANQKVYTFLSRGYRSLSGTRGPQLSSMLVY